MFFLLEALTRINNNTFPFQQHFKVVSDLLPPLARVCSFEQLIRQQMVWFQDSILECLYHHTLFNMLSNFIFDTHCARILSCFGLGVSIWLITRPTFPTFWLYSPPFFTMFQTWFGLPHPSITCIFQCVCTHPIDVTSVHLVHYTHDAICDIFVTIAQDVVFHVGWNNYTHFLQSHSIPFVNEVTFGWPKMELTP